VFLLLFFAQSTEAPSQIQFDLAKISRPNTGYGSEGTGDEIVVCGKAETDNDRNIVGLPPSHEGLPKAEFGIVGNVRAKIAGQKGSVGNIPTNRAMITVTVPF
jgi:hypothetical protein